MYKYLVSVIVPTYNRRELLEFTLNSLLSQNVPKDEFEVIVSDDGSSDGTKEAVKKYQGLLHIKYLYQEDKGYCPASARNSGVREAEGRICLFVDAGVILNKQCISEHVGIHGHRADRIAALGYVYGFDQNGSSEEDIRNMMIVDDPAGTIERLKAAQVGLDIREKYYKKYNDRVEDLPAGWALFWTCHVSVCKKELVEIGLFDEGYNERWGCEDNDLGFRLSQNGVKITLCRSAEAVHFPHEKNMVQKQAQGYENCKYFHDKFQTEATRIFLENYMQLVSNEAVDINELLLCKQP